MTIPPKRLAQARDPRKQYVTVEEAVQLLNVSERTVRRLISHEQVHVIRDASGFVRIDLDDIHARNAQKPHQPHPIVDRLEALQQRIDVLASQVNALKEQIHTLTMCKLAEPEAMPTPLPLAQPSLSAAAKRNYPVGTLRLVDFAKTHQVTVGSIKSLYDAGVIALSVYQRPTSPARNKQEWWITPAQHLALADYWQTHHLLFTACPDCQPTTEEEQREEA